MRWRWSTRVLLGCLAAILVLPACSSSDDAEDPPPAATASGGTGTSTEPSPDPGTTGASTAIDACALIADEDAEIALGAEIEVVQNPFGEGLIQGDPAQFAGACAYRPIGTDDGRAIAIGVAAPGSITSEEFDELTEDAIPLGGPGDEGYAVDEGVLFRSGDLVYRHRRHHR